MDRAVIKGMIEDYYRALLPALQRGETDVAEEIVARFDERIKETSALLPPVEGAAFSQAVETERETMLAQYRSDPVGLKTR